MTVIILLAVAWVLGVGVLLVACVALGARAAHLEPPMMEPRDSQHSVEQPPAGAPGKDPPGLDSSATDIAA